MTNKELQQWLSTKPDDAVVIVEYCNVDNIEYDEKQNLIKID